MVGSGLLELLKAGDARLDVADNFMRFVLVAGFQMRFQPFQQRLDITLMTLDQVGDVSFINRDAIE